MKNHPPQTAFILAAGFGTRLLPLTLVRPKPLLPLWHRPMLEHLIRLLASWGVTRLIINLHHEAGQIRRFTQHLELPGIEILFSEEHDILGTGGALAHARHLLDDEPFWLLNADVAASLDPAPFLRAFHRQRPLAALWLNNRLGPRTVEMKHGRITTFQSRRPGAPATYTFCGLHLLSPDILRFIPPTGFSSIITAYEHALRAGHTVIGLNPASVFWSDIGTPGQYIDAHLHTARARAEHLPGGEWYPSGADPAPSDASCIAPSARIAPSATLCQSVIWENARVGRGVTLERCIVASGACVHQPGLYRHTLFTPAAPVLTPPEKRAAARHLAGPITIETLPPRGSNRSFARLTASAENSAILIRYDASARPENRLYADHTRRLERLGLPVPHILHHSPEHHFLLMEDGGREDLTTRMQNASPRETLRLYRRVLDAVVLLHTTCTRALRRRPIPLEPPFGPELYHWEHQLFLNEFVTPRKRLTAAQRNAVTRELKNIARLLARQPAVLLHRDLQSSNILLRKNRILLIDYQGMRLGPAAYDLASLLYDPYVPLDEPTRLILLQDYNRKTPDAPVPDHLFFAAGIQRLVQALGAYGRLAKNPATARFSAYIPPALHRLDSALSHFPELTKIQQLTQILASC